MFTGIVTGIGTVARSDEPGELRLRIAADAPLDGVALGASIACSGVCLTVVDHGPDWFDVDVSAETRSKSAAAHWQPGARVNLERALKLGDELGGHIVTGHVDGVAEVLDVAADGGSTRIGFRIPSDLAPFVAPKGSITIDGVSLTVNDVEDRDGATRFAVNIIPHTAAVTTLGAIQPDDLVNVEIDVLARYMRRMMAHQTTLM